jgi:hypothetical protein
MFHLEVKKRALVVGDPLFYRVHSKRPTVVGTGLDEVDTPPDPDPIAEYATAGPA